MVTQPTLGLIGEAGPEAIIPLSKLGGLGGGINVSIGGITVQGGGMGPDEVAAAVAAKLRHNGSFRQAVRQGQRGL